MRFFIMSQALTIVRLLRDESPVVGGDLPL